jgi:hypothetical protein
MRFPSSAALTLLAVVFFVALDGSEAHAAETVSSDTVIIREDVVVEDDLYASGFQVLIQGEVRGDLIVIAGEELVVDGLVHGSVFALAQKVEINGEVRGSVRTVAAGTNVRGSVLEDLVVVGVRGDLEAEGSVGGDVLVWAWNSTLTGEIGGDVGGVQRNLDLAGVVGGEVDVSVETLEIVGDLTVGGDLTYRSDRRAEGLDRVDSGGVIVQKTPLPSNIRVRALGLMGKLLTVILLTAVAMVVALNWPAESERAGEAARRSPALAFGLGLAVLISPAVLALIAFWILNVAPTSASLPLLAVMLPIIVALTTFVALVAVVAGTPSVVLLGRLLRSGASLYGAVAIGSALVGLVWLLPRLGLLVPVLVLPIGIGSWILAVRRGAAPEEATETATV